MQTYSVFFEEGGGHRDPKFVGRLNHKSCKNLPVLVLTRTKTSSHLGKSFLFKKKNVLQYFVLCQASEVPKKCFKKFWILEPGLHILACIYIFFPLLLDCHVFLKVGSMMGRTKQVGKDAFFCDLNIFSWEFPPPPQKKTTFFRTPKTSFFLRKIFLKKIFRFFA